MLENHFHEWEEAEDKPSESTKKTPKTESTKETSKEEYTITKPWMMEEEWRRMFDNNYRGSYVNEKWEEMNISIDSEKTSNNPDRDAVIKIWLMWKEPQLTLRCNIKKNEVTWEETYENIRIGVNPNTDWYRSTNQPISEALPLLQKIQEGMRKGHQLEKNRAEKKHRETLEAADTIATNIPTEIDNNSNLWW